MLSFLDRSTVIRGAPSLVAGAPRLVIGAPRLVIGASRLVIGAPRCSLAHPKFSLALRDVPKLITIIPMVILYHSLEIAGTLEAGQNALLRSDTLLKFTHISLHSTYSQTLLEASSDWNIFCWCRAATAIKFIREWVCATVCQHAEQHLLEGIHTDSGCN